ncbi:MAG: PhnD/SsuA/transferrin family substrate-binding protein [Scytonema sp. PMC 1070.18]|nr:PhnD/SsuA/transferrin family substrate-binding protein [Scytonema sp. PMC 1070.18]
MFKTAGLIASTVLFLGVVLISFVLSSCGTSSTLTQGERLSIGVISYEKGTQIVDQFTRFQTYLAEKTGSRVELEPAFNENLAIERIKEGTWSLVFAPPGLAALAMARYQYSAIFSLTDIGNLNSLLVVRQDSSIREVKDLQNKNVALGQPGSATGYYLPLYNLYGLTLAGIEFAPTPKTTLEWVEKGKVAAGAVSNEQFNLYSPQLGTNLFRVLPTDTQNVPSGVVLVGPSVDRNRQEFIRRIMRTAPSIVTQQAGYLPNGQLPDYRYMTSVVERVSSIANKLRSQPVQLY